LERGGVGITLAAAKAAALGACIPRNYRYAFDIWTALQTASQGVFATSGAYD
jgi:hypothetical protein